MILTHPFNLNTLTVLIASKQTSRPPISSSDNFFASNLSISLKSKESHSYDCRIRRLILISFSGLAAIMTLLASRGRFRQFDSRHDFDDAVIAKSTNARSVLVKNSARDARTVSGKPMSSSPLAVGTSAKLSDLSWCIHHRVGMAMIECCVVVYVLSIVVRNNSNLAPAMTTTLAGGFGIFWDRIFL